MFDHNISTAMVRISDAFLYNDSSKFVVILAEKQERMIDSDQYVRSINSGYSGNPR